ncbi:hypothetical protein [Aeromicrobium duanguangcaii]|uniref:Uncharacterized protein n=1 Tax=Aeromicrobium duanguangcaii TaxID=2968086 RepID=A0ABY5KHL5_9ACTN|nr:hypothetical protein [Aeromicrobium duanguangcaii]MCD9152918.1 hypothetical protein [Aeromicrobium duanguangcaii]UUI69976.1 hypothetical protein NP095_07735 [Aeromicrobium duanguangcaii]
MHEDAVAYITAGAVFDVADITFYADSRHRSLDEAIADAEVLVTCPDATASWPAELEPWVSPALTRRRQDDVASGRARLVARRWATIDPTVIYVENPHPRIVSHPDPSVLVSPDPDVVAEVAARGADVYRATRLELVRRLVLARSNRPMRTLTAVTLHDEVTPRDEPAVLTLGNGGDHAGDPRPLDPFITMDPERLRLLADSHRAGFGVRSHGEIALNRSRSECEETVGTARDFDHVDAVRADLSRAHLTDIETIEEVARRLRRSWLHYRTTAG